MYTKEEQRVAQDKVDDDGPRAGAQEHNGYRNGGVDEAKDIAVARQAHAPLKQRGRGKDDDGAEHRDSESLTNCGTESGMGMAICFIRKLSASARSAPRGGPRNRPSCPGNGW